MNTPENQNQPFRLEALSHDAFALWKLLLQHCSSLPTLGTARQFGRALIVVSPCAPPAWEGDAATGECHKNTLPWPEGLLFHEGVSIFYFYFKSKNHTETQKPFGRFGWGGGGGNLSPGGMSA